MSLPSWAIMYKNGGVVATTMINVGWHIHYDSLIDECYKAYNYCLEQEKREASDEEQKRFSSYVFENWKNFDHMQVYEWTVPRTVLDEFFLGKITKEEFVQRFKDGSYLSKNCDWLPTHEVMYEDFNKKKIAKYGDKE